MSDESALGLLLRAHTEAAAQSHGEMYVHKNISASNCWDMARQSIEGAIQSVMNAQMHVARNDKEGKR